jgi:hypothetical protein
MTMADIIIILILGGAICGFLCLVWKLMNTTREISRLMVLREEIDKGKDE